MATLMRKSGRRIARERQRLQREYQKTPAVEVTGWVTSRHVSRHHFMAEDELVVTVILSHWQSWESLAIRRELQVWCRCSSRAEAAALLRMMRGKQVVRLRLRLAKCRIDNTWLGRHEATIGTELTAPEITEAVAVNCQTWLAQIQDPVFGLFEFHFAPESYFAFSNWYGEELELHLVDGDWDDPDQAQESLKWLRHIWLAREHWSRLVKACAAAKLSPPGASSRRATIEEQLSIYAVKVSPAGHFRFRVLFETADRARFVSVTGQVERQAFRALLE